MIFIFATLYGFGKTFFWPTMLGVVSEQCPKGGALTLNAIAGIGMLTVGIVGGPLIGAMQEGSVANKLPKETYEKISVESSYLLGGYTAVDAEKVKELADADKVQEEIKIAKQGALARPFANGQLGVGGRMRPNKLADRLSQEAVGERMEPSAVSK